ncbi:MAG: hypothetical protein Q8S73_18935, partial [Deltaproteobacteria bacterium]|nr:hypothetical protein [Deltaproteobacteria bacterium]
MARPATLPGLVWLGLGLITLPAAAQSPGFHDLLRAGVEHRRAQREAEAFAAFSAAWEQCRCPEARVQMALAAQALGRWCDAAALLDEALGSAGDPFVEGLRPRLTEERRALDAHVGSLRVEVDSPSALVSLDGAPIASAPAVQCAPAGPHALTVTAPGRVALTRALV